MEQRSLAQERRWFRHQDRQDVRDRFFQKASPDVQIELPSDVTTIVSISKSFWKNCSELRSQDIGLWMIGVGLPLGRRAPRPVLKLEPASGRVFRLAR
jgi:hypothetical protein